MNHRNGGNMHYITRIDAEHTHAWFVRIVLIDICNHVKTFSDGVHGGKRKALAQAKKFRDGILKRLSLTDITQKEILLQYSHKKISPRNSTGVIGVQLDKKRVGMGYQYYTGSYYVDKFNKKTKSYSFPHQHTKEEAFALACEFRVNGIAEIEKQRKKIAKKLRRR